jgi:hypothetical protein
MRKLDIDDRFGGIIQMARVRGLEYQCIAEAMAYGLFFKVQNEHGEFNPQDELFLQTLKEKGVKETLIKFCRFKNKHDNYLINELNSYYIKLKKELPANS